MGTGIFDGCTSLATLIIDITNVGSWFSNNNSIKEVILGNNVSSIELRAFYGCMSLNSIIIGNSVTSIGHEAFSSCYELSTVTIPESVTSIGVNVFQNCINVSDVYCYADPSKLSWNSYNDFKANKATKCHVLTSELSTYQSRFGDIVNVTFVGDLTTHIDNAFIGRISNELIYDFNGRRANDKNSNGIYIKNGKKYIIK